MIDLTTLIESIEKLAYNILMWALLVPKTLVKVLFNPGWAPDYVSQQLKVTNMDERFGEYFSPVILILLATLLPFAYATITPLPSVALRGPEKVSIGADENFVATANFISKAGQFTYDWTADGFDNWRDASEQNKDFVVLRWDTPGWRLVTVTASNASGETYYDKAYVYVSDPSQVGSQNAPADNPAPSAPARQADLISTLEGPTGILAALAFLAIPLLFAIATEAFRGQALTRTSLMRSFFIQCYYFSPFGLAAWSLIIGAEFLLTPVQAGLALLSLLVVLVMFVWLLRNETNLIARERGIRKLHAFLIVIACLAAISGAAALVTILQADQEILRLSLGWFYAAAVSALLLSALAHRALRRRAVKKDDQGKQM
jgi:hypothetical protein